MTVFFFPFATPAIYAKLVKLVISRAASLQTVAMASGSRPYVVNEIFGEVWWTHPLALYDLNIDDRLFVPSAELTYNSRL